MTADMPPPSVPELLVCTTCRRPEDPDADPDAPRPGQRLYDALMADPPMGVRITPVACLSNCSRGCSVVLRGPGRWTFVYGDLAPDSGPAILHEGAARYRDAPAGLVPWRERPAHFRHHAIARIPPMEFPDA